jgi:hypothetical protein
MFPVFTCGNDFDSSSLVIGSLLGVSAFGARGAADHPPYR